MHYSLTGVGAKMPAQFDDCYIDTSVSAKITARFEVQSVNDNEVVSKLAMVTEG